MSLPMLRDLQVSSLQPQVSRYDQENLDPGVHEQVPLPQRFESDLELEDDDQDDDSGSDDAQIDLGNVRGPESLTNNKESDELADLVSDAMHKLYEGPLMNGPSEAFQSLKTLYQDVDKRAKDLIVTTLGDGLSEDLEKCVIEMEQATQRAVDQLQTERHALVGFLSAKNNEAKMLLARLRELGEDLLASRADTASQIQASRETAQAELDHFSEDFQKRAAAIRQNLPNMSHKRR
ncbi:hypothetical protein OIO90_000229 [Microbotryomycetes sp. JL221]|nr:hypothetical protein OIO90_000229 [Microbotryomycetes sp. JL221]